MTHQFEPVEEPDGDGGLSVRQKINLMLTALVGGALAIFIVQNTESQSVSWLSFEVNLALWIIVVGSVLICVLLTVMSQLMWRRRRNRSQ